jgi:hypothetical protein
MPDDYMADAESPAEDQSEGGESTETQTALLSKDFFGSKPLEIGTECKVKIEKIYDDEVQVSYVPHGNDEAEPEEAAMPEETPDMMADMG